MILLNYKTVNIFDYKSYLNKFENKEEQLDELIKEYEEIINFGYLECPECGEHDFINYSTYERNVVIGTIAKKINIRRVQCKNCKKTHSLLPPFLKPKFQYESSLIDDMTFLMEETEEKITELESKYSISRQILNYWRKRYKQHKLYLMTTIGKDIKKIFERTFKEEYYKRNHIVYFTKSVYITYYVS